MFRKFTSGLIKEILCVSNKRRTFSHLLASLTDQRITKGTTCQSNCLFFLKFVFVKTIKKQEKYFRFKSFKWKFLREISGKSFFLVRRYGSFQFFHFDVKMKEKKGKGTSKISLNEIKRCSSQDITMLVSGYLLRYHKLGTKYLPFMKKYIFYNSENSIF